MVIALVMMDTMAICVIINVHQNVKLAYRIMSVPVVLTDSGEKRVQHATRTVLMLVMKPQDIAGVETGISMVTRTTAIANHVPKNVTIKHVITILECVTRVAWMDIGEIIAMPHAAQIAMEHVTRLLDIAYSVQLSLCMGRCVINNVVQRVL